MAVPTVQRVRRQRLSSINDSKPFEPYTAVRRPSASSTQAAPLAQPCCAAPELSIDRGSQVCYQCGTVIEGNDDIVAEVTFGENSNGAAIVQGGFVGDNQRFANSMGGTVKGIGGTESRQQTERNGQSEINKLCASLQIAERIKNQAFMWYKLGLNHNFVQGRRIRNVAAVAIYLAARKSPQNTLMLMDLAEKVRVNVWALGDTYKQFCKTIMETDPENTGGSPSMQDIEPLMLKFCRKLEFDEASHRVAEDAVKILKRMQRDWMAQGRNPAGICGACIIIAARMNNFRRTVREVVYVVRVADTTINQRLYEFRRTQSASLTANQFREFGQRLKVKTLPPSIWRREEKEQRAVRRKRRALEASSLSQEIDMGAESPPSAGSPPAAEDRPRISQRGEAVKEDVQVTQEVVDSENAESAEALADMNTDPTLDAIADATNDDGLDIDAEDLVIPKKRGRPPKPREPVIITEEDLDVEDHLEKEVNYFKNLIDRQAIFKMINKDDNHEVLVRASQQAQRLVEKHMPNTSVNVEPQIDDDEFEDDPDVANCVLTPREVAIKEKIWMTLNEDWLREQQAKMLAKALEEAQGKPKKPKLKRKHHQLGDGSVLGGVPAANAADAARRMFDKRGVSSAFSKGINYEKLYDIFPDVASPATQASSPSAAASVASPKVMTPQRSGPQAQSPSARPEQETAEDGADDDGEDEAYAEEDEQAEEEEEEDLEHQYLDDDEGFDPNETYDDY